MLPPYVIGFTARDGHVVRNLNRYERGVWPEIIYMISGLAQSKCDCRSRAANFFVGVVVCACSFVVCGCLLVLLWVFFVPAEQFSSQLRFP